VSGCNLQEVWWSHLPKCESGWGTEALCPPIGAPWAHDVNATGESITGPLHRHCR